MFRLEDLTLFVRAAALGSFSDAAREAGQQPAQVSAAIKRLETILNIRLFARSTRSLRLTPEGETWLPYATQMLDTLEAGLQKIQTPDDEIRGMLQIAVPSDLGRNLLLTLFRDFRQRHPALRLRLLFSDQLTDVFKDPVDVAFRYGNNDDASFISLPVAPENRRVLVASPEWIARHGEPQTLQELGQHNALIYILRGRPFDRWSLSLDGEVQQQKVSGTVMSDDAEVIRRLAVAGEAGLLDEEGNMPQINRPFMVDSIAAALGPWVGIPAATALIESSAAAEAGGKTGLTALSAAVMFLLMLLFTPVALMIPKEATAPALILIGLNMFSGLRKVDLGNFTDGLPVLMMVMITLIANSFGTGIAGGLLFYIVIKAIAGKWREIPIGLWVLAVPLVYYFATLVRH